MNYKIRGAVIPEKLVSYFFYNVERERLYLRGPIWLWNEMWDWILWSQALGSCFSETIIFLNESYRGEMRKVGDAQKRRRMKMNCENVEKVLKGDE